MSTNPTPQVQRPTEPDDEPEINGLDEWDRDDDFDDDADWEMDDFDDGY